MRTPLNDGILQSDIDFDGFKPLNADLSDYDLGGDGGGSNPLLTINVTDAPYSAAGDGVTNDTAAIQAAIDALIALGGGTLFFPQGTYLLSGALQSPTNSQLVLPAIDYNHSMVYIRFLGDFANWKNQADSTIPTASNTGTIIKSNITGLGGTEPAMIAVHQTDSGSFYFSNLYPVFENILFRTYDNPELGAVNMRYATHLTVKNCAFDTGTPVLSISQPTHAAAVAIIASGVNNNGMIRIEDVVIFGYYTGITPGEHSVINNMCISLCNVAMQFDFMYHATWIGRVLVSWCPRTLKWTAEHYVTFGQLDIEHNTSGWYTALYDVDDPSNKAYGTLNWQLVTAFVGVGNPLIKNGGANLATTDLYTGAMVIPASGSIKHTAVAVASLPGSPSLGQVAAVSDGTAALAWGATVTGGGSTKYLVFYNGSNWTVAGK